ncbi:MAG: tRNA (adenosine(37)-N6)-dimethylallyltransferase MiaA [Lachnospiraceae bacterium]|nr:tRNA (adenosine(37)-N6)-dimethylallyltransferase MiaA [Lachnospiraceae bacterium]
MERKKPLIVLTGPTAVGKTELSVCLAKKIGGEIISADSIQIYKYMDIGSAKITQEEMQGVRHYLVDELDPSEEFNIYIFQSMAKKYINKIYDAGKIPIVAGGTGFYIQSLLYDIDFTQEDNNMTYRKELESLAKEKGNHFLHDMLKKVDEEAAEQIHENNVKRVIRALEYYKQTGEKISHHNEKQRQNSSPYEFKYFVLNMDRNLLYQRIDQRVNLMLEKGLVEEVEKLRDMGYGRQLVSMQGIGYKEIYAYLEGEMSLEEAVYVIKRDTRHFAKRQLTWFRREKEVQWINYEDYQMNKDKILEYLVKECSFAK